MRRLFGALTAIVLTALIAVWLIFWPPILVQSSSMNPSFFPGDLLLIRPLWPWEDLPRRGQVIALRMPDKTIFLKRVAALPGEVLQMRDGHLYLNGSPVPQHEIGPRGAPPFSTLAWEYFPNTPPHLVALPILPTPVDNTPRLIAPPGHVLVLGDHRGHSTDSRVPYGPGAVARQQIHGIVIGVLFRFSQQHHPHAKPPLMHQIIDSP